MTTFTADRVLTKIGTLLQDPDAIRWPLQERLDWINDAVREIAAAKPSSTSETIEMTPQIGTLQRLPAGYHQMLDAIRNLSRGSMGPLGRVGGRAINPLSRDEIDELIPNWHNPTVLPYAAEAFYVITDQNDPTAFYTVPGNTGFGLIEVSASAMPAAVTIAPGASPTALASYAALVIPLPIEHLSAVVDYVAYRCLSKEVNMAGSTARAQMHFQAFQQAIGIKTAAEISANPNSPRQRPAM